MRHAVSSCLAVLVLAACAPRVGKFKDDYFAHEYHPYRIAYAGEGVDRIMGPQWEAVNWVAKDGEGRWSHRSEPEFVVSRTFDFDGDGNQDYFRLEAVRDFEFKHRQHDARLWLQVDPQPTGSAESDLASIASAYLEAQIAGAEVVGETFPCEVSGLAAVRLDFSAGQGDAAQRGRLVAIDPGHPEKVGPNNLDVRVYYHALYVADPDAYTDAAEGLPSLLDRLAIGAAPKTVPAPTPNTCTLDAADLTAAPAQPDEEEDPSIAPAQPEPDEDADAEPDPPPAEADDTTIVEPPA